MIIDLYFHRLPESRFAYVSTVFLPSPFDIMYIVIVIHYQLCSSCNHLVVFFITFTASCISCRFYCTYNCLIDWLCNDLHLRGRKFFEN